MAVSWKKKCRCEQSPVHSIQWAKGQKLNYRKENELAKVTPQKKAPAILKSLGSSKASKLDDNSVALLIKEKTRIPVNTVKRVLIALRGISQKYSK